MIAPLDYKLRIAADSLGSARQDAVDAPPQPEKIAASVKHWVGAHPTAAVVTCAVLGLIVGYFVKRR